MPRETPPTSALTGLSSPPTAAAMNPAANGPSMPDGVSPEMKPDETITQATAATPVASAQPRVSILLTRTPRSLDTSGASAAARSCNPRLVNRNNAPTARAMTTAQPIWNTARGESATGFDPRCQSTYENGGITERWRVPQIEP